jgi:7-keto-8-aminopelargonate synthetase-like enzyme
MNPSRLRDAHLCEKLRFSGWKEQVMSKKADRLNTINTAITQTVQKGLVHLTADSEPFNGRIISLEGRSLINFGLCSYLGLEMDARLKQEAIDAVMRYGTQFASSRAYLSLPLYRELEHLLQQMVDAPVLIAPTTTLGHLAALPTLVQEGDAVMMDQQVHHSVQMAVEQVRISGIPVRVVRHNDMKALERHLGDLTRRHRRVWYLADGVYSMFGDLAPVEDLNQLLDRYQTLHLYLDDAQHTTLLERIYAQISASKDPILSFLERHRLAREPTEEETLGPSKLLKWTCQVHVRQAP